ncbi:ATP-binding protein [Spongiimicrobium sp. 3-5]|uniref:PAS domain-containing sensor histidine kinase n=1 Tax=Spongiimicrobium sp. 3-5 TaxID=3332596 RepID=UPI003980D8EF
MKVFKKNSNIFNLLSEGVSEGIVVVNSKQLIVANNSSTEEIFGYEKDELVGKPLNILVPQTYHASHHGHFENFFENSGKRQMAAGKELYGLRKSGEEFPLEVGLNPFELYGNKYVMALIMDISSRKEQELKITELNTKLEEKIEKRTSELNTTIGKLTEEVKLREEAEKSAKEALKKERELNDLKTKFLSMVSHEFKTPLSSILTSTVLLSKYSSTEQQDKREKHINTIKNKVKYLDNILNDFLSVERLESGKVNYKFSRFPLSKLVNEVVYSANMLLKTGQQILYPRNIDEVTIEFDEKILELILSNLVHNAIKYSPENTEIDIKIAVRKKVLYIQVIDQGIGIPEEEQKYVFNRYFRAENALLVQGTGIGLNIVKAHLENLGGTINFKSKENVGTTFSIQVPFLNKPVAL